MVDKIRRAFEELDPPICPSCYIDMKWVESSLVAPETIAHLFHCPNCGRVNRSSSKIELIVVPPDKLAAPRFKRAA